MPLHRRKFMENKELELLAKKYRNYYSGRIGRDLFLKMKRLPAFEIGSDDTAWTGKKGDIQVIHVGLGLFTEFADSTPVCADEMEWHSVMRFLTGHECGHQKYTTDRAFSSALRNGYHSFTEYAIQEVAGKPIRMVKESDYDAAYKLMVRNGVRIDPDKVKETIHFIVNALEDGRMERKVMAEKPGFRADVIWFRGRSWMHTPVVDFGQGDPYAALVQSMNQLLSLATTGVYQKGYMKNIAGSETDDFIRGIKDDILAAVTSKSCAKGMMLAERIMKSFYPLILNAFRSDSNDQAFSDLMKSSRIQLPDMDHKGKNPHSYSQTDKEDSQEENNGNGPIGSNIFSDKGKGEEPGNGRKASREGKGSQGNGKAGDGNEKAQAGGAESNNGAAGKGKGDGSSRKAGDAKGNASGNDSHPSTGKAGNDGNDAVKGQAGSPDKEGEAAKGTPTPDTAGGGNNGSKGQEPEEGPDDTAAILEAMRKAVETASKASESTVTTMESVNRSMSQVQEREDTALAADAIGQDVIQEICKHYHEHLRQYELKDELPVQVFQECSLVRRQYEQYFRSRMKPTRKNQKSGKFDPHQLSRLVQGDLDVYRRLAKDGSFSGCIYILLDNSGSMQGRKKDWACNTLTRAEEYLKGLVPLKIVAFDSTSSVNVEIIKNWDEVKKQNCSWNYARYSRSGGGTPTKEVLNIAMLEIMKRSAKHKMIVLITDEHSGCSNDRLQPMIRQVRANGIQLCAIYIENGMNERNINSFRELFDNTDAVACEPSQIGKELLPVIQKFTQQR